MELHGFFLGGIFLLLSLTTLGWRNAFAYRKIITLAVAITLISALVIVRSTEMAKIVIEADLIYDGFIWLTWLFTQPLHRIR